MPPRRDPRRVGRVPRSGACPRYSDLESLGELAGRDRVADAVFVGGSLVPAGGHNILEPAAYGKVPLFGPSMENFREMSGKFLAGAAVQVREFTRFRRGMGKHRCASRNARRAWALARGNSWTEIAARPNVFWSTSSVRAGSEGGGGEPFLGVASVAVAAAFLYSLIVAQSDGATKRRNLKQNKLPGTVISVGNLTVGGTGKTPMVLAIAERLAGEGKHAADPDSRVSRNHGRRRERRSAER